MNTSLSWIKAYVPDLEAAPQEFADAMTLSGTKVEGYKELDKDIDKIVVGKILSIEKHPDADKLVVCQVDVGTETLQIVTGAPNVEVGQKVPVVLDGGRVAGSHDGQMKEGGIKIKSGKLRGVESFGMMCSIEELGQTRDMYPEAPENGIYIFPEDTEVGADAIGLLGLHDAVFEYEITSNRVDCYSVLGIAREAAATFNKEFVMPEAEVTGNDEKASDYISIEVRDPDLCPRYIGRVVKNIKLAPSPKWLRQRLAVNGIRPINNVVDITNYVMEEYGQPMHAFDYDTLAGHQIVVRRAEDGEKFVTLDGQERTIDHDVLMICDGEKPVAMAGIMGGENSMITDSVKTMLFESATFDGTNIRMSSKRVGLRTESSNKFEKGLDPENAMAAINRACQLIEELGAGEVVGGCVDVYASPKEEAVVPFDAEKINALLGTDISEEEMIGYLKRVELFVDPETKTIRVPSFRQDVLRLADVAEEVARFYGYDRIPVTLPGGEGTEGRLSFKLMIEELTKRVAEFNGFSQGMTYSFESPKVFDKLLLPADSPYRNAIPIMNPLGEDFSVMRTLSLNGMLTSLAANFNNRRPSVRLYEIGNVYLPKELPLKELPDERMQLTLGMYGSGDFFDMKGVVEGYLLRLGIKDKCVYDDSEPLPFYHPGRKAAIIYKGVKIGHIGEIHPKAAKNYDIKARVYTAVIDIPAVMDFINFDYKYEGIARFPAVTRDISMVIPADMHVGTVEQVIEKCGGKLLENFELFDVYEGEKIGEGKKSVAYNIRFRAKDRTLEDADIAGHMDKIISGLEAIGASLRK